MARRYAIFRRQIAEHRRLLGIFSAHSSTTILRRIVLPTKKILAGVFRQPASGLLKIGSESIQFVSDKPADSRTWLYRDIETIGRPDSVRFRVTTNHETYVLEL